MADNETFARVYRCDKCRHWINVQVLLPPPDRVPDTCTNCGHVTLRLMTTDELFDTDDPVYPIRR